MVVWYEELDGSPVINMDRKGGSAHREIRINWDDINLLMAELFPDPWFGYLYTARFPGYDWLVASKVKCTPFDPANPNGQGELMNVYQAGWRIAIDYEVPQYDLGMQGGLPSLPGVPAGTPGLHGGDHSGPGGSGGSAGGQAGQDQTFVTHKVTMGGEFITWPSNTLRWGYPKSGLLGLASDFLESNFKVGHDTVVGTVLPSIEHHITWHFVPFPPWSAMRQCVGRLNAYTFAGAPPGTLLFLGCEASIDYTSAGAKAWTMGYKLSEKNMNPMNPLRPMGWNWFLRPDGVNAGTFQQITRRVPEKTLSDGSRGSPRTTLLSGVGSADVVLNVVSGADFPPSQTFRVVIDPRGGNREECAVVGGYGGNAWTVLRGINGTKRRSHGAGAPVLLWPGQVYDFCDFRYLFQPGIPL